MHLIALILTIILALLIGCQWHMRFNKQKGLVIAGLIVVVTIIQYLIAKYTSHYSKPGLLRFLWIKIGILLTVPILFLLGEKIGTRSCISIALIGTGVLLLFVELLKHEKEGGNEDQ